MSKNPIGDNSVQASMLPPLWGRAIYSQKNPDVLNDPKTVELLYRLVDDFGYNLVGNKIEYFGLTFVVRARNCDNAVKEYIHHHPHTTVVNLGAGLDTTFSRIDNGQIKFYNIDLEEVIELRNKYLPDTERNISIAQSVLDESSQSYLYLTLKISESSLEPRTI